MYAITELVYGFDFTQQDIDDGIAYFEALKTCEPQNCTIHGTS